tara:strand:+ start:14 stop:514 length:501 start_codon:yes stop_codon:yes gene_type:complete
MKNCLDKVGQFLVQQRDEHGHVSRAGYPKGVSCMKKGRMEMGFCTVINCMDGRVQLPVIFYLQNRFNVEYVDSITEAGPNLMFLEKKNSPNTQSILERLKISIDKHNSVGVAIVGHHDCAGNPAPLNDQIIHIKKSIAYLRQHYKSIEIIGLWLDENWEVHEVIEI